MRMHEVAIACGVTALVVLEASSLWAQTFVGTWVRKDTPMTLTVEMCCGGGRRLTYHVPVNGTDTMMIIETALDGKDAPVLVGGQPSGETMAIRQTDDHHASAVLKMNGQPFGTAKGVLSADGKTITIEDDFTAAVGGNKAGKQTEIWTRK